MTHVTCRLTAKNRDQLRNPTLGNRVWATFLGELIGSRAFSTALALLTVSRHTRTQSCGLNRQKFVYRGTLHWCDEQNSSTVDLVYYTYDGRSRRG